MSSPNPPAGADSFADLRAEYERAWLPTVFIEPPELLAVASMRSVLVLGESGSGKSALRLLLEHRFGSAGSGATKLVAPWLFAPLAEDLTGSQLVQACIDQVFAACAAALMRQLGRAPEGYLAAPRWVQETVTEYILTYLATDPPRFAARIATDCSALGQQVLQMLALQPRPNSVYRTQSPTDVITQLTDLVRHVQLESIWIMVDGLETWTIADPVRVASVFQALLAALALFEVPGFALKIFAPATLEAELTGSSGVTRRRLDVFHLQWPTEKLVAIVEKRFASALQTPSFTLADLCATDELELRLARFGGLNPRAWLELARPYAETYFRHGGTAPLSAARCAAIARDHPPLLHIDLTTDQVFLGHGELAGLQPGAFRLLRYLYENRSRPCTRSELYYRAHLGLSHVPRMPGDKDYEAPSEWRGAFDTVLWRLRKQLEPDPKQPVYVVAVGSGFQVQHAW